MTSPKTTSAVRQTVRSWTAVDARTVETVIGGSLMSWATYRDGKAADWIAQDLEAVLAPWLGRPRARGATASRGKRDDKKLRR